MNAFITRTSHTLLRLVGCAGLTLAVATQCVQAQPITTSTYESLVSTAEEVAATRPYSALKLYEEAYKQQRTPQLAYTIGRLNLELRDYRRAATYLERYLKRASEDEHPEALFYLGYARKRLGDYSEATDAFKRYLHSGASADNPLYKRAELELSGIELARQLNEPPRIKVDNAGRLVNTSNQEYSPVLAADGTLYYAGFGKNGYIEDEEVGSPTLRLFAASPQSKGFGKGRPLPKTINRDDRHTSNLALSADGQTMVFVRNQLDGKRVLNSKLYTARLGESGRWGRIEELRGLNGNFIIKNPAFGKLYGEDVLFFAANIPGGEGGFDLYYAKPSGSGQYSAPINLGPEINTAYDEETPYFHDGVFYFSSDGYPSLGGFDIYRTENLDGDWRAPENMGKGFNSSYDDRYFQLDPSGKRGVLTSNRPPTRSVKGKTCCDDIFLLNVEPIIVPLLVEIVDEQERPLAGVDVDLIELFEGDSIILSRKLNPGGNVYEFELVDGKQYLVTASKEAYEGGEAKVNTIGVIEPENREARIRLVAVSEPAAPAQPVEETVEITTDQPIRLGNIYYDFDDDKILPAAEQDLDYLIALMRQYPDMVIEIGSHTDSMGRAAYNKALSQRRAQSAVDYITDRGIAASRLRAVGYGEANILNGCTDGVECSEEQHRFNRRTEFKIIEGPTSIRIRKSISQERVGLRTPNEPRSNSGLAADPVAGQVQDPPSANGIVTDDMSSLYYESDVSGVPILQFDDRHIGFGLVKKGDKKTHRYTFKNVGDVPASISIVSACSCTTLDWTKGEIKPGESGFVEAVFDSSTKDASELIGIDVVLDQEAPSGNGIIERVDYTFIMNP